MTRPPFAVTLGVGTSLANHTGSWRTERPEYVELLAPCSHACPAGESVQAWLYAAEEGRYEDAWRRLVADHPLPAVSGRVCFHPCQTACNRATLDEAVGIHAVERFLGDRAIAAGWRLPAGAAPSGRRVLVVGAGPAGLSAAYHLRQAGHAVTVREAAPAPGGMLRYGIPRYRLPRDVLDAEIERLLATGITLETAAPVTDLRATMDEGGYDAAFVAVGAQLARRAELPAGDSGRVLDALALLHRAAEGAAPSLGRHVVVYGGGDTAMDAARTVRRLGATDAVVVYRRTRERMPAHAEEVAGAEAEGVTMRWLSTIAGAGAGQVVLERMVLDDQGFPQPTGELEELGADAVVLALGEEPDFSLLEGLSGVAVEGGAVITGPGGATGRPGVFAGGDLTAGERTVTAAVGDGKAAARAIDAVLRGTPSAVAPPPAVTVPAEETPPRLATAERLNTWYYADAPPTVQPELVAARRATTFDEVVAGLGEANALFEARRCLSCGNCFECDNCYGMCPDNAVVKLEPPGRYRIDYDYCKGCGLCAEECPCGAIDMVPEPAATGTLVVQRVLN